MVQNFFVLLFGYPTCGILVPQPGIEPAPPTLEVQSLNCWTPREVPQDFFDYFGSLALTYEFWDHDVNFCKEASCDFARNYVDSIDQLE